MTKLNKLLNYNTVTAKELEGDYQIWQEVMSQAWPEFIMYDNKTVEHGFKLFAHFSEFQFAYIQKETQIPIAVGNAVPMAWKASGGLLPESGWDWALAKACSDFDNHIQPDTLCALSVSINPKFQGHGLSRSLLETFKKLAMERDFGDVIVPVRPSLKQNYPLIPIEKYIQWKNKEGFPFDPWLRVHEKLGAISRGICHKSMTISGTPENWASWTGMVFPDSGQYVVRGGLCPVLVDKTENTAIYVEPNVWYQHKVG